MLSRFRKQLLTLTALAVFTAQAAYALDTDKTLRIQIPKEIATGKTLVVVGESGLFGAGIGPINSKPGQYEFSKVIRSDTAEVKVIVSVPGYSIGTLKIARKDIPDTPIPITLNKLSTVPLSIKLTTYHGKPIKGYKIAIRQSAPEHEFMSICDGMVFWPSAEPVASGTTDSHGMLTVQVPQLLEDPFVASYKNYIPYFQVSLEDHKSEESQLVTSWFQAQRRYGQPQIIQLAHQSQINGTIKQSFLDKHGIPEPMGKQDGPNGTTVTHIWLYVNNKIGWGNLTPIPSDGTFSFPKMLPGTYDITLQVQNDTGRTIQTIQIENNFVLDEDVNKTLILK